MKYYNNILETIGNTPLVKINKITKEIKKNVKKIINKKRDKQES